MKKVLFALFALGTLGFSACKDKEKAEPSPILGKWEITDYSVRLRDSITNGSLVDTTTTESYAAGALTFNFLTTGKVITTEVEDNETYTDTGNYSFNAPVLKLWGSDETEADAETFNVSFSGNNVALKPKDEFVTFDLGAGLPPLTMKMSITINGKKK
jgi:hypothetical protein